MSTRTTHSQREVPQRIETVIIGAGQAGLSVGRQLAERDCEFAILEANERVGDSWRRHYDSLRLYNPAPLCSLSGLPFPGSMADYPTKDEVAAYLETYATELGLPVHTGTWVNEVSRDGDNGYQVIAGDHLIQANNLVVATGTFGRPYTPSFSSELNPEIVQLHSSAYKNPAQAPAGTGAGRRGGALGRRHRLRTRPAPRDRACRTGYRTSALLH